MTVLHAFPRVAEATFELPQFGLNLKFKPNAAGHVVCDVGDELAIELLLRQEDHFRVYDDQGGKKAPRAAKRVDAQPASDPAADYVLVSGDDKLDLRELDDDQLRKFAAANEIDLAPTDAGDSLRDKIVAALRLPAKD